MTRNFKISDQLKILGYKLYTPILKIYWFLFRPFKFGTRLLIYHPELSNTILLIRHTYGDTTTWNMPGGGYKPKNEGVEEAARREAFEEVGLEVKDLKYLGEQKSTHEYKRDTVSIYSGIAKSLTITLQSEIAEANWYTLEEACQLKAARSLDYLLFEILKVKSRG